MSRQRRFVGDGFVSIVKMLAVVLAVTILVGLQNVYAARLYVNAGSTGNNPDGSSWAKAFHNLQDALDKAASANSADEIWVAQGTYQPSHIYTVGGFLGGAYGRDNPGASGQRPNCAMRETRRDSADRAEQKVSLLGRAHSIID